MLTPLVLTICVLTIFFKDEKLNWLDYGNIAFGFIYFAFFLYQNKLGYLSIENGFIKHNDPFGATLKLSEIKEIKRFAGDYILKTDSKKLSINTQVIDPNSLIDLQEELAKLNLS